MKSIVLLSGGLDSTVLATKLKREGHEVFGVSINYGQRHKKELEHAERVAYLRDFHFQKVDLSNLKDILTGSSQTDDNIDVPEGHYAEESMKQTVVPNRNMVLLAIAGAYAIAKKADQIAYAAHAGDHTIYPDCRPEFADYMQRSLLLADWHKVVLARPFIEMTKADIVKLGYEINAPLFDTWSCYKGLEKHCGKCGTCVERKEAFQLAGVEDRTEYE